MRFQKTNFRIAETHTYEFGTVYYSHTIYVSDEGHCYINEKEKRDEHTFTKYYDEETKRRVKFITVAQARALPLGKVNEAGQTFTYVPYIIEDGALVSLQVKVEEKDYLQPKEPEKPHHPDFFQRADYRPTLHYPEFYRYLKELGCTNIELETRQKKFERYNERKDITLQFTRILQAKPVITQYDFECAKEYMKELFEFIDQNKIVPAFIRNENNTNKYVGLDQNGNQVESPLDPCQDDRPTNYNILMKPQHETTLFFVLLSLAQKRNHDDVYSSRSIYSLLTIFFPDEQYARPSAAEFASIERTLYLALNELTSSRDNAEEEQIVGKKRNKPG